MSILRIALETRDRLRKELHIVERFIAEYLAFEHGSASSHPDRDAISHAALSASLAMVSDQEAALAEMANEAKRLGLE